MNVFLNLFLFYMKQMIKSYLYIGTMVFMMVMLVSRFFIHWNEEYDYMYYGMLVGEMTVIVQALLLLFMVFFYKHFSDEIRYGTRNLFVGSFRITLLRIAALFANHLLFLTIFTGIQVFLIFLYFSASDIPFSSFYIQTVSFILVYWFLPFTLAFFVGILTAVIFEKRKISFIFLITIWIAIGPLNQEFFSDYFNEISFSELGSLFYIGTSSIDTVYNELVGYEVSLSKYAKISFWIITALILLLLALLRLTRTGREKAALGGIVGVALTVNLLLFPQIFQGGKVTFDFTEKDAAVSYYKNLHQEVPVDNLRYSVDKYIIKLNITDNAHTETTLALSDIQTPTLSFSLYHLFDVVSVTGKDGQNFPFIQDGDFITVERLSENSSAELTFQYDMKNSYMVPVSDGYFYLPFYLNWIPTKSGQPSFDYVEKQFQGSVTENIYPIVQHRKDIEYKLSFEGTTPFYTNLTQEGNRTFSEEIKSGVTAVGGNFRKEQFGDRTVIFPNSWSDIRGDWPVYEEVLVKTNEIIEEMFQLKEQEISKEIVLLTPIGERNAYLGSDHLLLRHGTLLNISSAVEELPAVYLPARLWNGQEKFFTSNEQIDVLNNMAAWHILSELNIRNFAELIPFWIAGIPDSFSEPVQELSNEQQKEFLLLWYQEIENVYDDWDKTVALLEEFMEGLK